jgi:hypothetical protein
VSDDDGEVGWRVRTGAGLLSAAPLNAELREAHQREDEKERKQAESAAALREQQRAERVGELRMAGYEPRTQEEFLRAVGWAQDRQDAVEAQREEAHVDLFGKGRPSTWRKELADRKKAREERAEAEKTTPATVGEAKGLQRQIDTLIQNLGWGRKK